MIVSLKKPYLNSIGAQLSDSCKNQFEGECSVEMFCVPSAKVSQEDEWDTAKLLKPNNPAG